MKTYVVFFFNPGEEKWEESNQFDSEKEMWDYIDKYPEFDFRVYKAL